MPCTYYLVTICDIDPLYKSDCFLFDEEFRPLNPTTLSLEFVDLVALALLIVCLFPEEAFLMLLALEDFTEFETLIPFFRDFPEVDPFPDFKLDPLLPELARPSELFLTFETLTNFLSFPLCSVIWVLAISLRTLSLLIASKLSFFLIASSILVAKIKSFLVTKLVTFPATEKSIYHS